jgi:putative ABC transport system substrate-binding protein
LTALVAVSALLLPHVAWPKEAETVRRIGVLFVGSMPSADPPRAPRVIREALAKHGYVDEKNLVIETRVGEYERLPVLAKELEQRKVELIWVLGTRAGRIVQEHVKRTPLVIYSCDPFEHVTKLSHPGSNATGTTCMTTELSPKRLELLKELLPNAKRVVFFGDPEDAPEGWRLTREAAPRLGLSVRMVAYKGRQGIPVALREVARIKPDAVFVYPDAVLGWEMETLARFWREHSLPSMNAFPEYATAGGLMAYGASFPDVVAMMAGQSAMILGGSKPGDVPVQRVTQFPLVINLGTARSLGIPVPQSLLLRADRIIE